MSDAEAQIIRLLTEIRDAQRQELDYRRAAIDESLSLSRRGLRIQRAGQAVGVLFMVIAIGWLLRIAFAAPH